MIIIITINSGITVGIAIRLEAPKIITITVNVMMIIIITITVKRCSEAIAADRDQPSTKR